MAEATPQASSGNKLVPILVVLLVIAAFVIGSLYTQVTTLKKEQASASPKGEVAAEQAGQEGAPPTVKSDVDVSDAIFLGDKNARIALVEFTDYQCPFCSRLVNDTIPSVQTEYIDTGKVRYYVMDYPLFQMHPQAQKAAEASRCAQEQGKYWEYHDVLFDNQNALDEVNLKKYAADLGLDADKFGDCLASGKYADKVKASQKAGESYGVRGTPATFVGVIDGNTVKNATMISGAVPFDSFKTAIEEALKK